MLVDHASCSALAGVPGGARGTSQKADGAPRRSRSAAGTWAAARR